VAFGGLEAGVEQGEFDILQRRGAGEEIEALKDKADFAVADVGAVVLRELGDILGKELLVREDRLC